MGGRAITAETSRFVTLYREEILPLRTREVQLLGRKCTPKLLKTFLGYEVQLNRKRVTCPDLTTARYVALFAELGCRTVRIPYDPTRTQALLSALEKSWAQLKTEMTASPQTDGDRKQATRRAFRRIRAALIDAEQQAAPNPPRQAAD